MVMVVQRLVIEGQEKEWRFEEMDPPLKWRFGGIYLRRSQVCRWKRMKRTVVVSFSFFFLIL